MKTKTTWMTRGVLLGALLALAGPALAQSTDLGPIERLDGVDACVDYLDALPQDRVKLARVNGHLALTESDAQWGWKVDMDSARSWCRYGINRVRVDVWEEPDMGADPYSIF